MCVHSVLVCLFKLLLVVAVVVYLVVSYLCLKCSMQRIIGVAGDARFTVMSSTLVWYRFGSSPRKALEGRFWEVSRGQMPIREIAGG